MTECRKIGGFTLCHFASPPTAQHECYEACWSQGRACRLCKEDCYRRGWSKSDVTIDNAQRVKQKRESGKGS